MTSYANFLRRGVVAAAMFAAVSSFAFADSITGTVTNRTTNKPAAGDDVVLIRLQQGMQEATRTKTDAKGNFTLDVPDAGIHLVKVIHDGASYFRPAPPGTQSVELDVFNAAKQVKGVSGEADVMRIQTDESGKSLRVIENFFVKNLSTPPLTQFSDRPFDFYLPAGAVVEGSAALAPGGMPVQASPVPLNDGPNHYAFVFPIRPCPSKDEAASDPHCGETRFQITYKLPYSGSFTFAPRMTMPIDTIAIMMPKSMTFKGGTASPYQTVTEDTTAQTYVARQVAPSEPLEFTVGGTGQMPRDEGAGATSGDAAGAQAGGGAAAAGPGSAAADTRPGGGLGTPIDPDTLNDPWAKYRWWIIGGLGLVLAGGAGLMLKSGGTVTPSGGVVRAPGVVDGPVVGGGSSLLAALKEELFALETDRLQGKVSEPVYAEQKAALEVVLRRALARGQAVAGTSEEEALVSTAPIENGRS